MLPHSFEELCTPCKQLPTYLLSPSWYLSARRCGRRSLSCPPPTYTGLYSMEGLLVVIPAVKWDQMEEVTHTYDV